MKRRTCLIAAAFASALALTGCGKAGDPAPPGGAGTNGPAPQYQVVSDADFSGSPVWKAAKAKGKLTIGAKFDVPGLGNRPAGAKAPAGFDIEIAKIVAAHLDFRPDQLNWVESASANREAFIKNGTVDMVVAIYTINDERKKVVDFAGPYYMAGQDLLVPSDSKIRGPEDLAGVRVCSTDGTVPAQRIAKDYPKADLVTYDAYSKCISDLQSGSVEAVSTDDAVLRGVAATSGGKFKVVGKRFSDEPYGVGMKKGDKVLRDAVNDALQKAFDDGDWKKAFDYTLGGSGSGTVTPPPIDRY